jgi:uncharacterized protein YjbI with pentapeptide repeats
MKRIFSRQRKHETFSSVRKQFLGKVWIKVLWSIVWRVTIAFPLAYFIIFQVYKFEKAKTDPSYIPELPHIIEVNNLEAFAILVAGIIYILEIHKRVGEHTEKRIKAAEVWQHIDFSSGKTNSYARIKALEFLNNHNEPLEELYLVANADLQKIDLTGANLKGSKFKHVNLRYAKLRGADLSNVDFRNADLSYADLRDANLNNANFSHADLYNADLNNAELKIANFTSANLRCAKLRNAKNINRTKLKGCLYNRRTEFPSNLPMEKKRYMYQISPEVNLSGLDLQLSKLYDANLNDANISNTNLRKADLNHANLQGVNLSKSDLREVNFKDAHLTNAKFNGSLYDLKTEFPDKFEPEEHHMYFIYESAMLQTADLRGMQFNGIDLKKADLSGADLRKAQLKGTHLNNADLSNAKLNGADLRGADLSNAKLDGTDFKGCLYNEKTKFPLHFTRHDHSMYLISAKTDLSNANLSGCYLYDADLKGANLKNANFTGADLRKADFRDANLRGTNFKGANLSGAKFWHCLRDDKTHFPDNFYIGNHQTYLIVPGADLNAHNLTSTNLENANLRNANLCLTNFDSAYLKNANLSNTDLTDSNLINVNFNDANLKNAQINRANLDGANLKNANLSNADLSNANLSNADLSNANFSQTNLTDSKLNNADLRGAKNLTIKQVKSALNWNTAKFDDNFRQKLGF